MALVMRKISDEAHELLLKLQSPGNGLYFSTNEVFTALLESCKKYPPDVWKYWLEKDAGLEFRDDILRNYRDNGGKLLGSDETLFQRIKATPEIKGLYSSFLVKLYDAITPKVGRIISSREREKVLGKEIVQDYVVFKKLITTKSYWNLRITLPKGLVQFYKFANAEKPEYSELHYYREDLSDDEGFDVKSTPNISEEQIPEEHKVDLIEKEYNDCKRKVEEASRTKITLEAELAKLATAKNSAVSKKRRKGDLDKIARKFARAENQTLQNVTETIKTFKKLSQTITSRTFGMTVLEAILVEPSSVCRPVQSTSKQPSLQGEVVQNETVAVESPDVEEPPIPEIRIDPLQDGQVSEVLSRIVEQVAAGDASINTSAADTDDVANRICFHASINIEEPIPAATTSSNPSSPKADDSTEKLNDSSDSENDDQETDKFAKSESFAGIFEKPDTASGSSQ